METTDAHLPVSTIPIVDQRTQTKHVQSPLATMPLRTLHALVKLTKQSNTNEDQIRAKTPTHHRKKIFAEHTIDEVQYNELSPQSHDVHNHETLKEFHKIGVTTNWHHRLQPPA